MRVGLVLDPSGDPGTGADEARLAEDWATTWCPPASTCSSTARPPTRSWSWPRPRQSPTGSDWWSSLTILPVYPLALAAKMTATLDRISHGRFELGIGVGGGYPPEFAASGVSVAGRGRRTDAALKVLLRLLTGERVTAEGDFGAFDDLQLDPPPVQQPHPPLWVGGRATAAQRRAGRFADVWMPYLLTPEAYAESLDEARRFADAAGRPAGAVSGALFIWGSVDRDPRLARTEATEVVSRVYRQDFEPLADRYLLHGDPKLAAARLRQYADAGAGTVLFSPACPAERRHRW